MEIVNSYFSTVVFTKVESPDEKHVMYAAVTSGFLMGDMRQVILLYVPTHLAIKTKAYIYELPWVNLQTRHVKNPKWGLARQQWVLPRDRRHPDINLDLGHREQKWSSFSATDGSPLAVLMMHDPKKKSVYQWPSKLRLSAALASFWCVINYTGSVNPLFYTRSPPASTPPPPVHPTPIAEEGGWHRASEPVSDFIEFIE